MNLPFKLTRSLSAFIVLGVISLLLSGCGESYYVLTQPEIAQAYSKFDTRFIPNMQKVVLKENRDVKASAIYYLGRYYCDFSLLGTDDKTAETEKSKQNIENLFYQYYDETRDFNLKNLIASGLTCNDYEIVKSPLTPLSLKVTTWLQEKFISSKKLANDLHFIHVFKRQLKNGRLALENLDNEKLEQKLVTLLKSKEIVKHTYGVQSILELLVMMKDGSQKIEELASQFKGDSQQSYKKIILEQFLANKKTK